MSSHEKASASGMVASMSDVSLPDGLRREFEPERGSRLRVPGSGLPDDLWERALLGPAHEFLRRPRKEFRARMVLLSWTLGGGDPQALPDELPLLMEVLHAGSLIVDDVQDQSEERRGAAALHRLCGVPLAINTGNWMYFWAFALLGRAHLGAAKSSGLYRRLSRTLMRCHEGQALDLTANATELAQALIPDVVTSISRLKTGSLMEFCGYLGARAAGAPDLLARRIACFSRNVGIGLQMLDDLGGLVTRARADKALEDLRNGRLTWPWAWFAELADAATFSRMQQELRRSDGDDDLRQVGDGLRSHVEAIGRVRITCRLRGAMAGLHAAIGDAPALIEVEQEVNRLRMSYGLT
jgi:geranylgeranyl pyrophosphate synthase